MGPAIESVEPASGSVNDEITIIGGFFGTKKGKVILGEKNCRVKSWTMNPATGLGEIHFVIPRGVGAGSSMITVINGVDSDSADFTVE